MAYKWTNIYVGICKYPLLFNYQKARCDRPDEVTIMRAYSHSTKIPLQQGNVIVERLYLMTQFQSIFLKSIFHHVTIGSK